MFDTDEVDYAVSDYRIAQYKRQIEFMKDFLKQYKGTEHQKQIIQDEIQNQKNLVSALEIDKNKRIALLPDLDKPRIIQIRDIDGKRITPSQGIQTANEIYIVDGVDRNGNETIQGRDDDDNIVDLDEETIKLIEESDSVRIPKNVVQQLLEKATDTYKKVSNTKKDRLIGFGMGIGSSSVVGIIIYLLTLWPQ